MTAGLLHARAEKLLRKRKNESWTMRSRHCGIKQVRLSRVGGLVMQNRPLCFVILMTGAAALSCRGQEAVTSTTKVEAAYSRFSNEATRQDAASTEAQSEP